MTACTNHGGKARRVVTAALVGVLSVGTVPMAALAVTDGISTMDVQNEQETWDASTFDWSADADAYGNYSVEPGDVFALESVTDVNGEAVPSNTYEVVYFGAGGTIVPAGGSINGLKGGMPEAGGGNYIAAVIKTDGDVLDISSWNNISDIPTAKYATHKVSFSVAPAIKSLEGAYAYEAKTDPEDASDTSFLYTGNAHTFGFADADGNVLKSGDYTVTWLAYPSS